MTRLRQYVKFEVWSDGLDPDRLTARIGIEPDETRVMGSRHKGPKPVPRHHWWIIRCGRRKVRVSAQADAVIARITPSAQTAIRDLVAGGEAQAQLSIVRWFAEEDDGDEEAGVSISADGSVLREGVDLYGWHFDHSVLTFLVRVGAALDVDEHDMQQLEENFGLPGETE